MRRYPFFLGRRLGPFGLALTAWNLWRHIPREQRREIVRLARHHGPRVARRVAQGRRR
jgi:hypothetical protein